MALNIFDISEWTSGNNYKKHDIVKSSNIFYYALQDITNSTTNPISDTTNWGGRKLDGNGEIKYEFIWIPSWPFNINHSPTTVSTRFGAGYEVRTKGTLNNNLLDADFTFEKRSLREATAIIQFLSNMSGVTAFLFNAPPPYNSSIEKLFVCKEFPVTNEFYDAFTIKAHFLEVPA